MVKVKGKVKSSVKRKPIKAGSTMPKNIGGVCNVKVVSTAKKLKNG